MLDSRKRVILSLFLLLLTHQHNISEHHLLNALHLFFIIIRVHQQHIYLLIKSLKNILSIIYLYILYPLQVYASVVYKLHVTVKKSIIAFLLLFRSLQLSSVILRFNLLLSIPGAMFSTGGRASGRSSSQAQAPATN